VSQGHLERVDLLVKQVQLVKWVLLDPEASLVILVHLDLLVLEEKLDYKEKQDLRDLEVNEVMLDHQDHLVSLVRGVKLGHLVKLDSLVPEEMMDHQDKLDNVVRQA